MDRSMQLRHLEEAERHVLRGEQSISAQEQRIEDLELHGHDTALARILLETFIDTQASFIDHREQIINAIEHP